MKMSRKLTAGLVVGALLMITFSAVCAGPLTAWLIERERAPEVLDEFSDLERHSEDAIAPGQSRHGPGARPAFNRDLPVDSPPPPAE